MVDQESHVTALELAVEIVGGQAALARGICEFFDSRPDLPRQRITQQGVSSWLKKRTKLDAVWWPAIEHLTGGQVDRVRLRPDVVFARENAA